MNHWETVQGFLFALFCGAFVGIERELNRAEDERADKAAANPAGIRTHILAALLGAVLTFVDRQATTAPAFAITGLALTAVIATPVYAIRALRTGHFGLTTQLTLLATYAFGALSMTEARAVAAALAVTVTATLATKAPLHTFVRRLTRAEVGAAVQLALIAIVLLPLIPDRDYGPLDWPWLADRLRGLGANDEQLGRLAVANPFQLWLYVVVLSAIGFGGYVLMRSLGTERGLALTGLVGGLVSSTAVTLQLSEQSREAPGVRRPFVAGILAANAVMGVRVLAIVLAIAPPLAARVAAAMIPLSLASGAIAWTFSRTDGERKHARSRKEVSLRTPFALRPAIRLAAVFSLIRIAGRTAATFLGGAGVIAAALFSGLVDVDAITVTVAQDSRSGLSLDLASLAVLVAVATNTFVKAGIARVRASRDVGRATMRWMCATLGAAGLGLGVALVATR
ncbi:MAG TPA: MgtC/SapB family protein [Planctomycetota bacterium]|nr:MgtC/SapB family protein [Planctomycetota bacterium]